MPHPVRRGLAAVVAMLRRKRQDAELDEELNAYLTESVAAHMARGFSREEAMRHARRELGSVPAIKDFVNDVGWESYLDSAWRDLRYSARALRRAPAFATAAVLTFALGIAASTAVFSIVDTVLLRQLPYASADRLVALGEQADDGTPSNVGFTTAADWRARSRSFDAIALMRSWLPTLVVGGEAERLSAVRVSAGYFDLLGVRPALGRPFTAEDDLPTAWRVLLLSDGLWRRRFNADPQVLGRTVTVDDAEFRIIGVMPPGYEPLAELRYYNVRPDVWAPLGYAPGLPYACRGCRHLRAFGRLRGEVTPQQASVEIGSVHAQLRIEQPNEYSRSEVAVVRLQDALAAGVGPALWVLFGAVMFVLLIACANFANLLLARDVGRRREFAVRAALGAGRGRLLRQLVTENLLLTTGAALIGALLAQVWLAALLRAAPVTLPRLDTATLDARVLLFTAASALLTGLMFGVIPALRASVVTPHDVLSADTRTTAGGGTRTRAALVIVDLALALVLLAGAGVMLRTVATLLRVDTGFNPDRVLTMQFSLVGRAWREDAAVLDFQHRLLERVGALPGVEGAAVAGQVPFGGNGDTWGFHPRGRMKPNPRDNPDVERYSVTPAYFGVMQIPLRAGRLFGPQDTATSEPVMLVSEETARAIWGSESPIGAAVRIGDHSKGPWRTVVGVVGDVDHDEVGGRLRPAMYLPQAQVTDSYLVLAVKAASGSPSGLVGPIRAVVRDLHPHVPLYDVAELRDLVGRSVEQRRFVMQLLSLFAAMAVVLAAVGLYGIVAYTVEQRTREVGLRMALGATRADIARLILAGGARVVGAGVVAGLTAALFASRALASLVSGASTVEPLTFAAAAALLVVAAALAHAVPLRRAIRTDPAVALRRA